MDVVDRAKAIRKELKSNFPGVKFSVRCDRFSMGSSINIKWTDFPTREAVENVVSDAGLTEKYSYTHYSNNWSSDMKEILKDTFINKYGENFYNEQVREYNTYRYELEIFENLYAATLVPEVIEVEEIKNNDILFSNEDIQIVKKENTTRIYFDGKPSEEIRNNIKNLGFRFYKNDGFYWGIFSNKFDLITTKEALNIINEDILVNDSLEVEEIETIIKHTEEYANQVLKEELQQLEELDNYKIVETDKNIFLNDISIARKPSDISDIKEFSELENIVISKYLILSNNIFDNVCSNFFMDFSPIVNQGGTRGFINGIEVDYNNYNSIHDFYNDKNIIKYSDNILIANEDNTKYIVVNPEGYNYCRYVGTLTAAEGNGILNQLQNKTIISVVETQQEQPKQQTNIDIINNMYNEVEALQNRLKLVTSAKLKYKIESQINFKMQEIAKLIIQDPILYQQFLQETKEE